MSSARSYSRCTAMSLASARRSREAGVHARAGRVRMQTRANPRAAEGGLRGNPLRTCHLREDKRPHAHTWHAPKHAYRHQKRTDAGLPDPSHLGLEDTGLACVTETSPRHFLSAQMFSTHSSLKGACQHAYVLTKPKHAMSTLSFRETNRYPHEGRVRSAASPAQSCVHREEGVSPRAGPGGRQRV